MTTYKDFGEGMCLWCEDRVFVPIYPEGSIVQKWVRIGDLPREEHAETGKSYWELWCKQKEIFKEALKEDPDNPGRFFYRLIVLCWPRGEGKSLGACLIQLWKFFNWPRQKIMLGANSKDQIKFAHYDIMRDIIINSPDLYNRVGPKNLQEKEIHLVDRKGHVKSIIRSISSFTGVLSNITGYTFSEIYDMKKPRFFVQLDGSIRTIPNALGVIDSTVSGKEHVLYNMYQSAVMGKTKRVFYSYRGVKKGIPEEYWNPNMTGDQLNDYRVKFPFGEFERYFLNLWSAGMDNVFSEEMVEETGITGVDGLLLNHKEIYSLLEHRNHLIEVLKDTQGKGFRETAEQEQSNITALNLRFDKVESIYSLTDPFGKPQMAMMEDLEKMGDVFDTYWAILAGTDFGDPYVVRGQARTILGVLAKGLPGSRTKPHIFHPDEVAPKYLYVLLLLEHVVDHSLNRVKTLLEDVDSEFGGLDSLCSERYGAWDMLEWCDARSIRFEPIYPNYDRQKAAFKELLESVRDGRYKLPALSVPGSKKMDLHREEMLEFSHDAEARKFGSSEKMEKGGVQDDSIYAIGWGMYGGRTLNVDDFRSRSRIQFFGSVQQGRGLVGDYRAA